MSIGTDLPTKARVEVILPVTATSFVCFRLYLRRKYGISFRIEDLLIVIALLFIWGEWGVWYYTSTKIIRDSVSVMTVTDFPAFVKACFTMELLYANGLSIVKFSILTFYLRAFGTTRQTTWCIYALFGIIGGFTLARLMATVFECVPFRYFWDRTINGYCLPARPLLVSLQALNWLTEIILLVFPIPLIWKLHKSRRDKIWISFPFLLGGLTLCASTVRLYYINKYYSGDLAALSDNDSVPALVLCNFSELSVALMTASLPAIRAPAHTFAKSSLNRLRRRGKSSPTPEPLAFPSPLEPNQATLITDLSASLSKSWDGRQYSPTTMSSPISSNFAYGGEKTMSIIQEAELGPRKTRFLFHDDDPEVPMA